MARGALAEEIGSLKPEPENDLIAYGRATFDQALSGLGGVAMIDKSGEAENP